ncbi:MAG TPA: hypothetical protein VGJ01_05375 [Pseudolabrys sp.]
MPLSFYAARQSQQLLSLEAAAATEVVVMGAVATRAVTLAEAILAEATSEAVTSAAPILVVWAEALPGRMLSPKAGPMLLCMIAAIAVASAVVADGAADIGAAATTVSIHAIRTRAYIRTVTTDDVRSVRRLPDDVETNWWQSRTGCAFLMGSGHRVGASK